MWGKLSAMALLRSDTFQKSFGKLNSERALRVERVLERLRVQPEAVSFSTLRASDATLRVVRVGPATRLVLAKLEADLLLLYVGAHDDVFRWATRNSFSPEALSSKAATSRRVEAPGDGIEAPVERSESPVVMRLASLSDDELALLELAPSMIERLRATWSEEGIMELVEDVEAVSTTLAEAPSVAAGEELVRALFEIQDRVARDLPITGPLDIGWFELVRTPAKGAQAPFADPFLDGSLFDAHEFGSFCLLCLHRSGHRHHRHHCQ